MNIKIKWFETFEAREAYFQEHVSNLIPASYLGAGPFWRAFSAIKPQDVIAFNQRRIACITAFPQDSLAFSSPQQVLRAAALGQSDALDREAAAVKLFKLEKLLSQALRTLSGGETVRLALAKAWLGSATHTSLSIASPYSWLDSHNAGLTEKVSQAYSAQNKPVTFLALNGENTDMPPATAGPAPLATLPSVHFDITARALRLKLSQSLSLGAPTWWADAGSFHLELASPCVIQGENGSGKSLFAKALAKITGFQGYLTVKSEGNAGPCRLLLQNTLSQSLLRIKDQFAPLNAEPLKTEFLQLMADLKSLMTKTSLNAVDDADSILNVKLALAAARLCQQPKLLLLDEPEWGLNYQDATAFVQALCISAHAKQIPVMIVSHKNWWRNMAQSRVLVQKHAAAHDPKGHTAFGMQITAVTP